MDHEERSTASYQYLKPKTFFSRSTQPLPNKSNQIKKTYIIIVQVDSTMERHNHDAHDGGCCDQPSSVAQTLSEMDFERGIWSAALFNEIDRVTKLLDDGTDPNVADNAGYTALHYAARSNNKAICLALIGRGANVNAITRAGKATPLHRAASAGHEEIVTLLLENGADPLLQDSDGLNALDRAVREGYGQIKEILIRFSDPEK